jgi:hypothetical protein
VLTAPGERGYRALLVRLDTEFFRTASPERSLPLQKRKLHVHVDWPGERRSP